MQQGKEKINQPGALLVMACLFLLLGAGMVQAEDTAATRDPELARASSDSLLSIIDMAWNMGDERVLADLVHPDGMRVNTGGRGDRLTRYSPSQAFYFFKNLFQKRKTTEFSFVRVQDKDNLDLTHALALWLWRQEDARQDHEEELLFVIRFTEDRWYLAEINSIK